MPVMDQLVLMRRRSRRPVAAGEGCDWTDHHPLAAHWMSGHGHQDSPRDPSTAGRCPSGGLATLLCRCAVLRHQHQTIHQRCRRRDRRLWCLCRQTASVHRRRQSLGRCVSPEGSLAGLPDNENTNYI